MQLRAIYAVVVGFLASCQSAGRTDIRASRTSNADGATPTQGKTPALAVSDVAAPGAMWGAGKTYDFHLRSTAMVDFGSPSSTISYELDASPRIIVIDQREDRTTLYVRLLGVTITNRLANGGSDFDRLAQELREGACLVVLSGGRLVELGLRKGESNAVAASFRQLASSLQLAKPGAGSSWQAEEYDTSGQYVAQYNFDDGSKTYQKEKLRYVALLGRPVVPGVGPLQMVPEIRKSKGRIRLSSDGYLELVDLEDALVVRGAQVPILSATHLVLNLSAVGTSGATTDPSRLISGFTMIPASELGASMASVESLDRARTQGATFRTILSRIEVDRKSRQREALKKGTKRKTGVGLQPRESVAIGDIALFNALVASLRESQEAVETAVRMIKEESPLSDVLIDALGSASSPQCEAALTGLLSSADSETKPRILYALSMTPRPDVKGVAAMKALLEEEPYSQTGLYGLGAYARRFAKQGNNEKAAEVGEFLIQKLWKAHNATDKITALRAVENSGYAPAIGTLQRYMDDPDPFVRTAAIRALRPMKDPLLDDVLASRIRSGASAEERLLLLEVAEGNGPSDTLIGAVVDVSSTPDVKVRRQAVGLLAKWAPGQVQLRQALKKIAEADSDPQVRASARAGL